MKRFLYTFATVSLVTASVAVISCGDKNADVNNFALDFGKKVSDNQLDSVRLMYPGAEAADSLALTLVADSINVLPGKGKNEFKVFYGDGKFAVVTRSEDGKLAVSESAGLFAFPEEDVKFAKETGAFQNDMTDAKRAEAISNLPGLKAWLFEEYVASRKNAITLGKLVVTKDSHYMMDTGRGYYNLTNNTDQPIKGSEYTLRWRNSYIGGFMGGGVGDRTSYSTEEGRDIPAHGTIKIPTSFTGHDMHALCAATIKTADMDTFMSGFKAKGNEYWEYMKNHKPTDKAGLTDGPYSIAGKIDGKYSIHMTLDKGMETGSYYYDKKGAANKLSLHIINFDPKTGKLMMEERNNQGEVTGIFNGTLTSSSFKGVMSVTFNGKSYNFDMPVTSAKP